MNHNITIIGGKKAYLSERFAYKDYFENNGFKVYLKDEVGLFERMETDIIWVMMGFHFLRNGTSKVVHEYQTIPVYGNCLTRFYSYILKRYFSIKPNLRIFKNEAIKKYFNFKDNVPYLYRDMGISDKFLNHYKKNKKYDFVYLGSMSKERKIGNLLNFFINNLNQHSLLLIGEIPEELNPYLKYNNIYSTGKLPYHQVPEYLGLCEYGIHYVPNGFSFNLSTKLLEYAAVGLKIVSNRIQFLDDFLLKYGGSAYTFEEDFSDFDFQKLVSFNYVRPNIKSLEWNTLLDCSGLLYEIKKLIY